MKLYLDMDGVMADFDLAVTLRFGTLRFGTRKDKWKHISKYNNEQKPWFRSLPIMPDFPILWDFVIANFNEIEILTALGNTIDDVEEQKRAWIKEYISDNIIVNVVEKSSDKCKFANSNTILVDDRLKAIKPFIEAGGHGIIHTSVEQTIRELSKWVAACSDIRRVGK